MEAGGSDGRDLMPPGMGQLRPAVAEQHQRPGAFFGDKNFYAVG